MGIPPSHEESVMIIFQAFFILYLRELKAGRFHHAGKNDVLAKKEEGETSIAEAKRHINNNLSTRLTTENLSQTVFMSLTHFMRRFQQETRRNFHDYLTTERLEEASRLLGEGS